MENISIYDYINIKLITQDCEFNYKLLKFMNENENEDNLSIFHMQYTPYLSFLCNGILDFLNIKNSNQYIDDIEVARLIKKNRAKVKMYCDGTSISKCRKIIKEIHEESYLYFKNIFDSKIVKNFDHLGYDFGTYICSNKFIGNTFLDEWYIDNFFKLSEINSYKTKGNIIKFYSFIGSMIKLFSSNESKKDFLSFNILREKIENRDFLLEKDDNELLNNRDDKYILLLLFNILSSINFVQYCFKNIINETNEFYFRVKFICYYYSINTLEKLTNYSNNNKDISTGIDKYIKEIKELRKLKDSFEKNSNLRNCILHYKITEKEIEENEIMTQVPFFGILEKYTKEDFYTLDIKLEKYLIDISNLLEKWILK